MHSLPACLRVRAAVLLAGLAVAACDVGVTIHPVIEEPAPPRDLSGLQGLWVTGDGDDYWVLRIAMPAVATRVCTQAELRIWQGTDTLDAAPTLEGRACLTDRAGHTLAELSTPGDPVLYQHYLVRLEPAQVSVCGGTSVWLLFGKLAVDGRPGFTTEGLQRTVRHRGEYDETFVLSPSEDLQAYLDRHLPRLAAACDEAKDDDSLPGWMVFRRVTPAPTEGGAEP